MKENIFLLKKFIRTLKNKIYKYMTSISNNACIDNLNDIVNRYNNTYPQTITIKPIGVKTGSYISFEVENNYKDTKFKVIKKDESTVPWTYVIHNFSGEGILGNFHKKEL